MATELGKRGRRILALMEEYQGEAECGMAAVSAKGRYIEGKHREHIA